MQQLQVDTKNSLCRRRGRSTARGTHVHGDRAREAECWDGVRVARSSAHFPRPEEGKKGHPDLATLL